MVTMAGLKTKRAGQGVGHRKNTLSLVERVKKCLKVSSSVAVTLVMYVLFVACSVKSAYLIDCCCLELGEVSILINEVQIWCKEIGITDSSVDMIAVSVEGNSFVVSRSRLAKMLNSLQNSELTVGVIDIDTDDAHMLCDRKVDALIDGLTNIIAAPHTDGLHISADATIILEYGAPFLAGLLLGYPVIYLVRPDASGLYTIATNKLSFRSMLKFRAELTVHDFHHSVGLPQTQSHGHDQQWNTLEFTVPSAMLDSECKHSVDFRQLLEHWKVECTAAVEQQVSIYQSLLGLSSVSIVEETIETQMISV